MWKVPKTMYKRIISNTDYKGEKEDIQISVLPKNAMGCYA